MMTTNSKSSFAFVERKLQQFKRLNEIVYLGKRMFNKSNYLLKHFRHQVSLGSSKGEKVWNGQKFLKRAIKAAIYAKDEDQDFNEAAKGLPSKPDNYVAFLDLIKVMRSTGNWFAFVFRDFDQQQHLNLELTRIRRRFKDSLPEGLLASVQLNVDDPEDQKEEELDPGDPDTDEEEGEPGECDRVCSKAHGLRVFIRVSVVKKTKKGLNDELNLIKKTPTFFAFYPKEPYFYCKVKSPDQTLCDALCATLYSGGFAPIPLSGPHLESLRRLRLNRDGKSSQRMIVDDDDGDVQVGEDQILGLDPSVNTERQWNSDPDPLPIINSLEVSAKSDFKAESVLVDFHKGQVETQIKEMDIKMTITGPDVLNTLRAAATSHDSECKLLESVPDWLDSVPNRGRNVITLKSKSSSSHSRSSPYSRVRTRKGKPNNPVQKDEDAVSIAGSELTVMMSREN